MGCAEGRVLLVKAELPVLGLLKHERHIIPCLSSAGALSLMGNHLDRITHLSYSELPTGDPSGLEKEELRVGVAYFFSDEEEEVDDAGGGGGGYTSRRGPGGV
ncbi:hypothetical protein J4Q44_G00340530, partial [Coregonus suidteri]